MRCGSCNAGVQRIGWRWKCERREMCFIGTRETVSFCFAGTANPVENVPPERFQNQSTASGTQGRSGLVRSALEKLPLFSPTFSVRQKHGAGSFAVCGQRLRGHVPSKNTSPAALSWSSLFGATVLESFCSCTMLFVQPDRAFCSCPMRSQKGRISPSSRSLQVSSSSVSSCGGAPSVLQYISA